MRTGSWTKAKGAQDKEPGRRSQAFLGELVAIRYASSMVLEAGFSRLSSKQRLSSSSKDDQQGRQTWLPKKQWLQMIYILSMSTSFQDVIPPKNPRSCNSRLLQRRWNYFNGGLFSVLQFSEWWSLLLISLLMDDRACFS